MTGTQVGSYLILEKLGQGGMGEVYKAEDSRLKRLVAIKVLRSGKGASGEERLRFLREARAVSTLNHPNIVQIYELESQGGNDFIVMEYVAGGTLAQVLRDKRLSVDQVLDYSNQIASALAAAHAAGIVHRDIKPGNMMVTGAGLVKILDFGLAKVEQPATDETVTAGPETAAGALLGTAAYMSPEQAEGKPVDARSDIFSTGAVLYEMLTGKRAFDGDSIPGILSRVLRDSPPAIRDVRGEVPQAVARIVSRCLEKDAALRYASGRELASELAAYCRPARAAAFTTRTRVLVAGLLVAAIGSAGWLYYANWRARWVRNEAMPEIRTLIAKNDYIAAFDLTRRALSYAPDDPQVKQHWSEISLPITLTTTPPGAKISYRRFGEAKQPWRLVGQTPLEGVHVPFTYMQIRLEKEGYEPWEFATYTLVLQGRNIPLYHTGQIPDGMMPVPAKAPWASPNSRLPDFFIDKFEVTNRQFQQFIDAGGYRDAKYWRDPFRKDGHEIPRDQALDSFRDATGRPGPAGWELGTYPKDQGDFPVSGVSWFEAGAYCEYAGKALPTVHHWRKAAGRGIFTDILLFSNFASTGTTRVGASTGTTPFGVYDMAGNVKEWCRNDAGELRAILGGGWNEQSFAFMDSDAQDPFNRGAAYGIRCAKYTGDVPPAALVWQRMTLRDYSKEKPVGDDTFEIFQRMYSYDKMPLDTKTERVDDSNENWRKEKVSYRAAYGGERIPAYLYLPKNVKPPYQAVLWMPGGYSHLLRSSETGIRTEFYNYMVRTGRAVLYPVYKGTFERNNEGEGGPNSFRDSTIQLVKDASRSLDFLESRSDIQRDRMAYYALSDSFGPMILALEPRLKAGIIVSGGLYPGKAPPEVDPFNFAPRVRVPVLMLNGRYDFDTPLALQESMFQSLGTPQRDKKYIRFETGHVPPLQDLMREALNWLDKYIGPVT